MISKMINHISNKQLLGFEIDSTAIRNLEIFATELNKWNNKFNLTAIKDDLEVAIKHILDALFLAVYIKDGERLLDIGSGAGLPAIPIKIVRPNILIYSVDSSEKKINFQKHIGRILAFKCFEAIHSRIEDLQIRNISNFDVITSRAFSSLERFVVLAKPSLTSKGRIIAMKASSAKNEVVKTTTILRQLGLLVTDIHTYTLPMNMGKRNLIVITKE